MSSLAAHHQEIEISPTPDWVVTQKVRNRTEVEGEPVTDLLFDRQVDEESMSSYMRTVYRVENSVGVDQYSRLSLSFSPERGGLAVHKIQIFRDGELMDRTEEGEFQILQREENLESSLSYDGRLTALKILYDIRIGDVIDYSYSIKHKDPIYPKGLSLLMFTEDTIPLGPRYLSWRTRNPEKLKVQGSHALADAEHEEENGVHRYSWSFSYENPVELEEGAPANLIALKHIELSNYSSFQEIAQLEEAEWLKDKSFHWEEIQQLIGFENCPDDVAKIEKAISWVLDNIRYQGIFVGALAMVPAPLSEVIKRRFGDCKENTALLVQILRSLGHEAWPALVSTAQTGRVRDRLVSPAIFDHAITCLVYQGERYWIDTTNVFVGRKLPRFKRSDFGAALILSPENNSLTDVAPYQRGDSSIKTHTLVRLPGKDLGGTLETTLTYTGLSSEYIRGVFSRNGVKGFRELLQNELREKFPSAEIKGELQVVHDDYDHFELHYLAEANDLVHYNDQERTHVFTMQAMRLLGVITPMVDENRRFPLAQNYPCTVTEEFEIHNTRFHAAIIENPSVITPYFQASTSGSAENGILRGTYFFETLKEEIPVSAFPKIEKQIEEAHMLVALPDWPFVDAKLKFKKSSASGPSRGIEKRRKRVTPSDRDENVPDQKDSYSSASPMASPGTTSMPVPPSSTPVSTEPRRHERSRRKSAGGPSRTSGYAVTSLVMGVLGCILVLPFLFAITFGHIALTKIKYDASLTGRRLAIAGLILGYGVLAVLSLLVILNLIRGGSPS